MGDLAAALRDVLPGDAVATDVGTLDRYCRDEAGIADAGTPGAVVFPRSTDEVAAVVRTAGAHRTPIVARGAGSGLTGGANALDGCVVCSLERMDRIVEIDVDNRVAVVEPGVLNADLSAAAAAQGLFYPPDPASWEYSTIGGNVANNAGGLCCVKYGVTGDFVLGLEVVLADGSVLRTGRRTIKGVAGYNLTHLLVGSEGTLGIITQATLRLRPPPEPAATVVAFFPTLKAASVAVAKIIAAGVVPSALEVLDRTTVRAVDDWQQLGLDREAAAQLLVQSDAGGAKAEAEIARATACCEAAGASSVQAATDPGEADELMAARRLALKALEREGDVLLDDVAVPPTRVPELIDAVDAVARRHGVLIGTFGHAGDGNMHPTIVFDAADPATREPVRAAFDEICDAALALGGTITGEHGVGLVKRAHLPAEIGDVGVRIHRAIKAALDPDGLLNPGKVI